MSAQGECGWQKPLQVVAMLTAIEVWCYGELPCMYIVVAVRATLELHPIKRALALGNVTLPTLQRGMLALQWICGRRVFL